MFRPVSAEALSVLTLGLTNIVWDDSPPSPAQGTVADRFIRRGEKSERYFIEVKLDDGRNVSLKVAKTVHDASSNRVSMQIKDGFFGWPHVTSVRELGY